MHTGSYADVDIVPNSVVYCDPPYRGTSEYLGKFDFGAFDDWLRTRDFPVYISEYKMPEDFICIAQRRKMCTLSATAISGVNEKIFVHERWAGKVSPAQLDLFGF